METLFETWIENEKELEALLEKLDVDPTERHEFRLFQVKCQRNELRAIKNELKNNQKVGNYER